MSEQQLVMAGIGLLTLAAVVLQPALMLSLVGSLVRGVWSLVVDAFALLLCWI